MKTKLSILILFSLLILPNYQSVAQQKISVKLFQNFRGDGIGAYNFFVGPDAKDFSTSIKGFGSGILDCFGMRGSNDIVDIGTERVYLSAGVGLSVLKYRLADNLVFYKAGNGTTNWMTDQDDTHDYVNTFFGYGKSKLITTSVYFPVDLTVSIGKNLMVSAGGYIDLNISARYKMKYLVGEDKVKEIIKSKEFRNFNPSTTKYGINAGIYHKKWKVGLSGAYCFTPFFESGMGPDIHEARVAISYSIKPTKQLLKDKED